ncbi:MAG: hypothetical protein K2Y40_18605 [Reyranella sp.]|jgi:hypothetical protein|nr:hypothetical protein [Reyranella sp.]
MIEEEPSSPACLAHEAGDAYMGFATAAEVEAFLAKLAMAECDGGSAGALLRAMLPRIRDSRLHEALSARLRAVEAAKPVP